MMPVYHIVIERISTGERAPSLSTRQPNEQAAREYGEDAIRQVGDADLRVAEITERR